MQTKSVPGDPRQSKALQGGAMGKVTFITANGERQDADAKAGESIMEIARNAGVDGITAECGGCLSCATCHVYLEGDWAGKITEPSAEEKVMVECAIDVRHNSRLSCQITYSDDLDGIEIGIPASQY
jgi:2Fe-2S ferredoxin